MRNLTGHEIRKLWLDFFTEKGHEVIPSASLLPHDDPTLLWINAGVAPLKKYFDGREKPSNPRLCNAQKSIRTNDIDNVGRTARHHTFFEMLGNFSIGNYFRNEVIGWAVELLFDPKWYGLDKDLIYITYYPDDLDTKNRWMECGIEESHLIPLEGNFWEIGEGPCGPDTEIFYDRGSKYDPDNLGLELLRQDISNDRYIEIWNIVLSQFNSVSGLNREDYPELPSKNIDTGSGLERLACIFQGTETNYETDLFMPYIKFIENYTHASYDNPENKMAFRVIADHVRSVTFAVADGANLSNEGRGYVLRRILRRAVRYGRKLGIHEPFVYKLVHEVVENMKSFYSYLIEKEEIVAKVIKTEEENFLKTLENGEKKIAEMIKRVKANSEPFLSGKDAFLLYDTFGFPIELTLESCEEAGIGLDIDGFNEELKNQKERARNARAQIQSMNSQNENYLNFLEPSTFIGYDSLKCNAKITGLFKDGKKVSSCNGDLTICLDQTPFYAEMGGQIGDRGQLIIGGAPLNVVNTFKLPNGQHAHVVENSPIDVHIGDSCNACVSDEVRQAICCNHSATHLLNESLRKVLGNHVVQHGSLVTDERLRFDFNHFESVSSENILEVEALTNKAINDSFDVVIKEMAVEEALKTGAQALFGEKYGDVVRVVDMNYSKELCGGTHVHNTSDIKRIACVGVESKGSGIFRIEAFTGVNTISLMNEYLKPLHQEFTNITSKINQLTSLAASEGYKLTSQYEEHLPQVKGSYQDILNMRIALNDARKALKELEKEYDNLKRIQGSKDFATYLNDVQTINGHNILIEKVEGLSVDVVKDLVDKLSNSLDNSLVVIANIVAMDKVIFVAKSKVKELNCGNIVKLLATTCKGNGGGRSDFAQSGGKDASLVDEAIKLVKETL